MKVAVLSESSADEAAIRVLVNAMLGSVTETPAMPPLRTRGWPAVRDDVPRTLKYLHYQTDTDALVVVVDSDRSPIHDPTASSNRSCHDDCRFCLLSRVVEDVRRRLRERPVGQPVKVAIGVAIPQIEAWYLAGRDPGVSEASWVNGLRQGRMPYDGKRLKRLVYSTDRPSIELETERALGETRRIVDEETVDHMVELFPIGFGLFAEAIKNW